jgi:TolB-like protein/Flp pilus assembly protein TadD
MSLLGELHRRHVLRVAAAYCVTAWLLIQVADIVLPRLGLPDWTVTFVIAVLALGFPLAIILAWSFDLTPDGIRKATPAKPRRPSQLSRGRKLDFAIIGVLCAAIGVLWFRQDPTGSPARQATALDSGTPAVQAVLVLPFRNMSDDPGNRYFAEGIAEEIRNSLVKLPQLRVSGRSASDALRERLDNPRTLYDEFNIDYVLDGSVRKQQDDVLITVQLTDARSGFSVWGESYEETLRDIFDVQRQISRAVVGTLKLELMPEVAQRLGQVSTSSTRAYDLYLRGLDAMRDAASDEDYDAALALFESALRIDPTFVEAEAGKCRTLNRHYEHTQDAALIERAIDVCNRAVAMDARSPKVQIALGHLYLATGRIEYALEAFDRAVAFAPMLDTAHRGRGDALAESGRLNEARQAYVRAIELSPRNPLNHAHYGFALYQNGQYEAATGQFREAARLDPDNPRYPSNLSAALAMLSRFEEAAEAALDSIEIRPSAPGYSNAGWHFYSAGRYDRAVEMFRKAVELTPADAKIQGNLADACRMHEACDDWRAHYEKALKLVDSRLGVNPGDATALGLRGLYNAHLGNRDAAIENLERALEMEPANLEVLWASAVTWSLLGEPERSREFTQRAQEAGYPAEILRADPFLDFQGDS